MNAEFGPRNTTSPAMAAASLLSFREFQKLEYPENVV
jgi:hypothetical protein